MAATEESEVGKDDPGVLALAEETLHVGKREVVRSRVRVSTVTEEVEEVVRESLQGTRVDVERVPVGRTLEPGEAAPGPRTEGDTTVIPVFEEVLVVEKRLVLKEELRIRQHGVAEDVEIPVTLRKQRAVVERSPPHDSNNYPTE